MGDQYAQGFRSAITCSLIGQCNICLPLNLIETVRTVYCSLLESSKCAVELFVDIIRQGGIQERVLGAQRALNVPSEELRCKKSRYAKLSPSTAGILDVCLVIFGFCFGDPLCSNFVVNSNRHSFLHVTACITTSRLTNAHGAFITHSLSGW